MGKLPAYRSLVLLVNVRGRGHPQRPGSDQLPNDDDGTSSARRLVSCLARGLLEAAVRPHRNPPVLN